MALPKTYEAVARFGAVSTTGDPEGEITTPGVVPEGPLRLPDGPPAPAPARLQRRPRRRPPRLRARAGRGGGRRPRARGRRPPLRGALARGRPRGPAHRVLVGDLRPQPRGRPRRRLHRGAAAHRRRAVPGARTPTRTASCRSPRRWPSCPPSRSTRRRPGGPASAQAVAGAGAARRRARPARRRRRADRDRRAPGGRRAEARRRLPLRMRVVPLTDAARRPRRVAVGTFDGVHLGHREVIAGADTVLTFEPHPLVGRRAGRHAAAADDAGAQGRARRRARRRGARGRPFDRELRGPQRAELRRRRPRRRARRHPRLAWGRTSASATARRATPRCWRPTTASRRASSPLLEADGEVVSSSHIRGLLLAGEVDEADRLLGAPFAVDGPVAHGDARGRDAGLPDGEPRPADGYVAARPRRLRGRARTADGTGTPPRSTSACARSSTRAAASSIEAYLVDFDGDLYGQPLRVEFLQAAARRAALRERRRARRADGPRRRARAGHRGLSRCYPPSPHDPHPGAQGRDHRPVRCQPPGHGQHPRPGRAAHRSGSTTSPSTCASTRRTTTRAAGCSCSSASAAGS